MNIPLKTGLSVLFCFLLAMPVRAVSEFDTALSQMESATLDAPAPPAPVVSAESLYAFHEHLSGAEALNFFSDRGEVPGEWKQNSFVFSGQDAKAAIRLASTPLGGGTSIIQWNPLSQAVRRLVFYDASPGDKIIFYYRLQQEKQTKENNYMTLTLWAGRHRLKRLRLAPSSKNAWQKEVIDLGIVSFFNRSVPLTVEIGTDPSGLLSFSFLGEVKR